MYHQMGNTQLWTGEVGISGGQGSSYHSIKLDSNHTRNEVYLPEKFWPQQETITPEGVGNLKAALAHMIKRKENAEAEVVNMSGRVRELVLSVGSSSSSTISASVLYNMDFLTDLFLLRKIITHKDDEVKCLLSDCGNLRLELARLEKKIDSNEEQATTAQSEYNSNLEKRVQALLQEKLERDVENTSLRKENDTLKSELAEMTKLKENAEAELLNVAAQIIQLPSSSSLLSDLVAMDTNNQAQSDQTQGGTSSPPVPASQVELTTGNGDGMGLSEKPSCSWGTEITPNTEEVPQPITQGATRRDIRSEKPTPKVRHGKGLMVGNRISCICGSTLLNDDTLQRHIQYHKSKVALAKMLRKLKQNAETKILDWQEQMYEINDPFLSSSSAFAMITAKANHQEQAAQMQSLALHTVESTPENPIDKRFASVDEYRGGMDFFKEPKNSQSNGLIPNKAAISSYSSAKVLMRDAGRKRLMKERDTFDEGPSSPEILHGKGRKVGTRILCLCGSNLMNEEALQKHIRYHNRERNWDCKLCTRTYSYRCYFKKHLEVTHNKIFAIEDQSYMSFTNYKDLDHCYFM